MKIVTAEQMKRIDRRAIRELGIPGPVLMENAAAGVLAEMERFFDGLAGARVGILCGKGNNGGDGLALARRLRVRGVPVRVALLTPFTAVSGEAKVNLSVLQKTDVEIIPNASARALDDVIGWSDILVDALLGVGISAPLKGAYAAAVDKMNSSGRPVVSIDIPTGIDADTGAVLGCAVRSDLTVTMALLKRGLVLSPGVDHAGTVRVIDIGMPAEAVEPENVPVSLLDRGFAWGVFGPRSRSSHKGDFGHLLVIAGSVGKAGAAIMAARGGLRTGAGLVSVAAPSGLVPIIQQGLAEAMAVPAAESIDGTIGIGAETELLQAAAHMTACAIGPGLSTHGETAAFVRNIVPQIGVPLVIDADGLNALAGHLEILKRAAAPVVLTPHPGEMARLAGLTAGQVQQDRLGIASDFARRHKVVLVLKGAGTVVAAPDGQALVNSTGNPGMATGGTGDVLTGMIGSLLAQGHGTLQAACLGVYLHGLAGDLAAEEQGEQGMIAGDLIEKIPQAIKRTTAREMSASGER